MHGRTGEIEKDKISRRMEDYKSICNGTCIRIVTWYLLIT